MLLPASNLIERCVNFFECTSSLNAFALAITYSEQRLVIYFTLNSIHYRIHIPMKGTEENIYVGSQTLSI